MTEITKEEVLQMFDELRADLQHVLMLKSNIWREEWHQIRSKFSCNCGVTNLDRPAFKDKLITENGFIQLMDGLTDYKGYMEIRDTIEIPTNLIQNNMDLVDQCKNIPDYLRLAEEKRQRRLEEEAQNE